MISRSIFKFVHYTIIFLKPIDHTPFKKEADEDDEVNMTMAGHILQKKDNNWNKYEPVFSYVFWRISEATKKARNTAKDKNKIDMDKMFK